MRSLLRDNGLKEKKLPGSRLGPPTFSPHALAKLGQAFPPKSGEYLFEIVMRRYEVKSTMMTSNRPLEEWGKLIGDVPAATAILDRFLHHAQLIKIKGKSYRMRNQACPQTA
jgi:hypothetical protein